MWVSCCRGRASACPEIRLTDNNSTIEIKDDYGAIVKMTIEQFDILFDIVREIRKLPEKDSGYTGF